MIHQTRFAQAEFADKKKTTRPEKFLARMEAVIPWAKLLAVLTPHYPKGERGRPPIGLERMLRVYFLQQWYGLADEALEDALYDSQALRGFARIDLATDGVPDATTLLKFRHPPHFSTGVYNPALRAQVHPGDTVMHYLNRDPEGLAEDGRAGLVLIRNRRCAMRVRLEL